MRPAPRTEVLVDGVWCLGVLWDWEERADGWWAVVSTHEKPGRAQVHKVPTSDVRVLGAPDFETYIDTM